MLSDSETRAREDLCGIDSFPVSVSSEHVERKERRHPLTKPTKNPKPNKNEDHELERRDPFCSEKPEWLQEFREKLVDERIPDRVKTTPQETRFRDVKYARIWDTD